MIAATLGAVLRHDVGHFGNRTAITIDDRGQTFAELARAVDQARALLAPLVRPGDRVAIALPNSFAWVAAFLALSELEAVSVPLNTRLTATEMRVILEDAEVAAVLACPSYRGRDYVAEAVEAARGVTPCVIAATDHAAPADWKVISGLAPARLAAPLDVPGVFCIQYTSGTTSAPKGVMLTQQRYLQTAAYVVQCQRLTPATSFMSAAPFFHCSGSMHAITTCLLAGSTLHSVSAWDPDQFLDLVAAHRGQAGHGVFFRDIVALGESSVRDRLATLKVAVDIGGPDFVRRLHDEFGITGISNIYGMTETCGNFTMWFPDDSLDKRIVLSGRPQPGNEIRIFDVTTGAPAPANVEGEIQMRGPTLTPGYYRRPEANAAAFTADGWFRSGDLGSVTADGELHYKARLRDIIRVGGENVSPAEVELAVHRRTGLKEFSIIGVQDGRLGEVVALVVPESVERDWPAELDALSKEVAGFKMPRQVWSAEHMPMTATNKVQRATLQRWVADGRLRRLV